MTGTATMVMEYYARLFDPPLFIAVTTLLLVVISVERTASWRHYLSRLAGTASGLMVAFAIYSRYGQIHSGAQWVEDLFATTGLVAGMSVIWFLWMWKDWEQPVTRFASYLGLLSAPYLFISPFWNISGHVTFTTAPALFLTLYNRRLAPLLIVPLIMVVNRPYLNEHTWLQSIGGLLLSFGVLALYRYYSGRERLSTVQA